MQQSDIDPTETPALMPKMPETPGTPGTPETPVPAVSVVPETETGAAAADAPADPGADAGEQAPPTAQTDVGAGTGVGVGVGVDAAATAAVADLSPAQCSARLAALFPALFALQQPLPLKLRIQADIQARAPGVFTRKSLSAFLHRYTTGTPYLLALTRQTQRFDLDGQPAGELAAEHRDAATTELARRRAIVEERRAAERAAQRDAQRAAEREAQAAQAAQRQQQQADQQGRRERALLLRAFETSTLTRANFCALKGLDDTRLDALLAQARQEAAERPAWTEDRPPRRDDNRRPGPHRSSEGGDRPARGGPPAAHRGARGPSRPR